MFSMEMDIVSPSCFIVVTPCVMNCNTSNVIEFLSAFITFKYKITVRWVVIVVIEYDTNSTIVIFHIYLVLFTSCKVVKLKIYWWPM